MIEELIGLGLMILNGWAAVIYWNLQGIPFWQATISLTTYWSITLIFTYWITNPIILFLKKIFYFLKKWEPLGVLIDKILKKIKGFGLNIEIKEKTINWLIKRKGIVIGILTFIPYIPELPTATIIAARIVKMKYGLAILLAGNAFRVFILCYTVYWGINLLNH